MAIHARRLVSSRRRKGRKVSNRLPGLLHQYVRLSAVHCLPARQLLCESRTRTVSSNCGVSSGALEPVKRLAGTPFSLVPGAVQPPVVERVFGTVVPKVSEEASRLNGSGGSNPSLSAKQSALTEIFQGRCQGASVPQLLRLAPRSQKRLGRSWSAKRGGSYYQKLWIDDVMKKAAYPSA
jgi:hypothetical protein